jgi:hypothetical protein
MVLVSCHEIRRVLVLAGWRTTPTGVRTVFAHRIAYELAVGPIPDGMKVLHACDNPPCCNPDHLSVGTQSDNVTDAMQKGRMKTKRGSNHKLAKLTEAQVAQIRLAYVPGSSGERSITGLAAKFGVGKSSIHRILHRQTWGHV